MSVRVTGATEVALYDSVTGIAFGETFASAEDAHDFLQHLGAIGERDPRVIPAVGLAQLRREWEERRT